MRPYLSHSMRRRASRLESSRLVPRFGYRLSASNLRPLFGI
jgi:hypothetical protein